tara:strand:+ start:3129 stop:3521 length:393 start_codon:yes stop_codon:yes gene_type:complete
MIYTYKNITGNTAAILLESSELDRKPIKIMSLCNIHATDNVRIDLYLYSKDSINSSILSGSYANVPDENNNWNQTETSNTYYIIKNLIVPFGSTVLMEAIDFVIDYNNSKYDLYIKLSESDSAVDVIIKN